MMIRVNGESYALEEEMTILALLIKEEVKNPEMVSVQLNGEFVPTDDLDATVISENDEIDYLYFMSGGQE
jgi:sulfur carrier protein